MGGCLSKEPEELPPECVVERSGRVEGRVDSTLGVARAWAASDLRDMLKEEKGKVEAATGLSLGSGKSFSLAAGPSEILTYMNDLLLELQMVSGTAPGLVLPELAQRLVSHLREVELCRVEAIIHSDAAPPAGVLLAAHGVGASVCEETPVVRGDSAHCWSVLQQKQSPGAFYVSSAATFQQDTAQQLPRDFRKLHERAGLSSFLSVLISAGQRVLGSLTIAARAPHAFSEPWWQPVLTMCASALLPHLRNRQLVYLCRMLVSVDAEQDAAEAASLVIYGVSHFMRATTNVAMAVRLGLIHRDRLLVIEQDPHDATMHNSGGSGHASSSTSHRVVASDIPLAGTLLCSAVGARKARFVSDAAVYFQRALQPASDVFTPASQLVSALVVAPRKGAPPRAQAGARARACFPTRPASQKGVGLENDSSL